MNYLQTNSSDVAVLDLDVAKGLVARLYNTNKI